MKVLYTIFILLIAVTFSKSQSFNKTTIDSKKQDTILIGYCTRTIFLNSPYNEWFTSEYKSYSPNNETLTKLKQLISEDIHIIIIFGSWCSDSKEQLPRFFSIIDKLTLYDDMIDIIAVDRKKQAQEVELAKYKIEKVPTFIFYKNGSEIGRIVETPQTTLENDMKLILKK